MEGKPRRLPSLFSVGSDDAKRFGIAAQARRNPKGTIMLAGPPSPLTAQVPDFHQELADTGGYIRAAFVKHVRNAGPRGAKDRPEVSTDCWHGGGTCSLHFRGESGVLPAHGPPARREVGIARETMGRH